MHKIVSFFAKKEEVNQNICNNSKDAYAAIFEYIESWYNQKRIHGSLNYMTPNEVYEAAADAA